VILSLPIRGYIVGKMRHEETYQGRRVVVTTTQQAAGTWTAAVEVAGDEDEVSVTQDPREAHASEEEARRAGLSAAAAAIDRARASRGKP
jgi:uncharacterized membrane protein YkoI